MHGNDGTGPHSEWDRSQRWYFLPCIDDARSEKAAVVYRHILGELRADLDSHKVDWSSSDGRGFSMLVQDKGSPYQSAEALITRIDEAVRTGLEKAREQGIIRSVAQIPVPPEQLRYDPFAERCAL
jgi:hypothetical protein